MTSRTADSTSAFEAGDRLSQSHFMKAALGHDTAVDFEDWHPETIASCVGWVGVDVDDFRRIAERGQHVLGLLAEPAAPTRVQPHFGFPNPC